MKAIIAYSGGLDTSYCVLWLLDQGYEVYTLTVDTGGFTQEELTQIATKAKELGASEHRTVDGKPETYKEFAAYVIKGNILRGGVYPLCVGAERMVQARHAALYAKEIGAQAVCHGSTGAGNDQVRFDVALMALAPEVKIIAPIRELEISRDAELAYLKEKGFDFPAKKKTYSINQGILGTTIGGGETHDPWQSVPDSAYPATVPAAKAPDQKLTLTITFEHGLPVALDGKAPSTEGAALPGQHILQELNTLGAKHGVGRGIHLGDTILGIKGRIAFEAPGATILINAHRELEKLVQSKRQQAMKQTIADEYGRLLHEGLWLDPVMRDLEAAMDKSQERVSGEVRVSLFKGAITVEGVKSPHSLMDAKATYGEGSKLWNGKDAEGFCKIYGIQSKLAMHHANNT